MVINRFTLFCLIFASTHTNRRFSSALSALMLGGVLGLEMKQKRSPSEAFLLLSRPTSTIGLWEPLEGIWPHGGRIRLARHKHSPASFAHTADFHFSTQPDSYAYYVSGLLGRENLDGTGFYWRWWIPLVWMIAANFHRLQLGIIIFTN